VLNDESGMKYGLVAATLLLYVMPSMWQPCIMSFILTFYVYVNYLIASFIFPGHINCANGILLVFLHTYCRLTAFGQAVTYFFFVSLNVYCN